MPLPVAGSPPRSSREPLGGADMRSGCQARRHLVSKLGMPFFFFFFFFFFLQLAFFF